MSRQSLVILESHITDGAIFANVRLEDAVVGNIMLTLSQWDALRNTYGLIVMNLSQQSDAEDNPDE